MLILASECSQPAYFQALFGGGGEVCFTLYPYKQENFLLCDSNNRCDWELTVEKGNPDRIE